MKRSGSPAGCGTQRVLDLCRRHAELGAEGLDVVSHPEPLENVTQPGGTVHEDRLPERPSWIHDNLGALVRGKSYQPRVTVLGVLDPSQVFLDDVSEHALAAS